MRCDRRRVMSHTRSVRMCKLSMQVMSDGASKQNEEGWAGNSRPVWERNLPSKQIFQLHQYQQTLLQQIKQNNKVSRGKGIAQGQFYFNCSVFTEEWKIRFHVRKRTALMQQLQQKLWSLTAWTFKWLWTIAQASGTWKIVLKIVAVHRDLLLHNENGKKICFLWWNCGGTYLNMVDRHSVENEWETLWFVPWRTGRYTGWTDLFTRPIPNVCLILNMWVM